MVKANKRRQKMKLNILGTILLSLGISSLSWGQQFKIYPGTYTGDLNYIQYGNNNFSNNKSPDKLTFKLNQRNNVVILTDPQNKINYKLDLNDKNEQPLSTEYINFLKKNEKVGSIRKLIDRITIRINNVNEQEINASIKCYLKYSSSFGSLSAVIQTETRVISSEIEMLIFEGISSPGTNIKIGKIDVLAGRDFKIQSLQTSLGQKTDNAIGLVADFIIQLIGGSFSYSDTLYENKR